MEYLDRQYLATGRNAERSRIWSERGNETRTRSSMNIILQSVGERRVEYLRTRIIEAGICRVQKVVPSELIRCGCIWIPPDLILEGRVIDIDAIIQNGNYDVGAALRDLPRLLCSNILVLRLSRKETCIIEMPLFPRNDRRRSEERRRGKAAGS